MNISALAVRRARTAKCEVMRETYVRVCVVRRYASGLQKHNFFHHVIQRRSFLLHQMTTNIRREIWSRRRRINDRNNSQHKHFYFYLPTIFVFGFRFSSSFFHVCARVQYLFTFYGCRVPRRHRLLFSEPRKVKRRRKTWMFRWFVSHRWQTEQKFFVLHGARCAIAADDIPVALWVHTWRCATHKMCTQSTLDSA